MPAILDQHGRPIRTRKSRSRWQELLARYDAAQTTDENMRHWQYVDGLPAHNPDPRTPTSRFVEHGAEGPQRLTCWLGKVCGTSCRSGLDSKGPGANYQAQIPVNSPRRNRRNLLQQKNLRQNRPAIVAHSPGEV